ncbi:MAG: DUF4070 domain-containing protein [Phycisphaerales bacterium]|nr:DUF4070 domain-containing protein [Phycisphaerales bacterium]
MASTMTGRTSSNAPSIGSKRIILSAHVSILTPYPGTPLFRKLDEDGRLLHRDWERYDTAHAVFQPRHMTPQQLEEGYAWCYRRLFSHASIWKRRPADPRAVIPYLAMSYHTRSRTYSGTS